MAKLNKGIKLWNKAKKTIKNLYKNLEKPIKNLLKPYGIKQKPIKTY